MITLTETDNTAEGGGTPHELPKIRALLIDDEPDLTDELKKNLEATGRFDVRAENSAMMGLESAREFMPQIIILDVCMPFLDGGDVLARLELDARLKETKVIMLSSLISHGETNEQGFICSNGVVMMAKPVCMEKMLVCIERRLSGAL